MKTFVKILVAIIVVAAICGGVYLVLPETAQIFVNQTKTHIKSIKLIHLFIYLFTTATSHLALFVTVFSNTFLYSIIMRLLLSIVFPPNGHGKQMICCSKKG